MATRSLSDKTQPSSIESLLSAHAGSRTTRGVSLWSPDASPLSAGSSSVAPQERVPAVLESALS